MTILTAILPAQEARVDEGRILSVDGNVATVQFDQVSPGVGDEVVFIRMTEIIDPVSLKVRGGTEKEVGNGLVEDIGLGRTYVSIISLGPGIESLTLADRARITGREKRIIRRTRVVGKIQELLDEDKIEIDVGTDDEINEGDMFLVQRTEIMYDPDTNEITGEKKIEVGRGKVSLVNDTTSQGDIRLNPGIELNMDTDDIVFEPSVSTEKAAFSLGSEEARELQARVSDLEDEVMNLRAKVDSLSQVQQKQQEEFSLFRSDMENVVTLLQSPGRDSATIRLRHDEPATGGTMPLAEYKEVLATCLAGDFDTAIPRFTALLNRYPDSELSENCMYWIGQSYYSKGDYPTAGKWFQSVKKNVRYDHKDDDASIMLGITYYLSGDTGAALGEFRQFISRYPDSEYRGRVERWISRLS